MTARLHHYIPQCYLTGFTRSGSKNGKLSVLDLERGTTYETIPRNVAAVRDFNRVSINGIPPDFVETQFSGFESELAHALRNLERSRTFVADERTYVLNLMALLAVRHPDVREAIRDFHEQIARQVGSMVLATPERWESTKRSMERDGKPIDAGISYEQLKDFHERGEYTVTVPNERHIELETTTAAAVLEVLARRDWLLLVADDAATGPFITGNRPVTLIWKDPEQVPPMMRDSPGFGVEGTQVVFAVSRNLAVVGDFNGRSGTMAANPALVGAINSRMIRFSRQVYAPKLAFSFLVGEGRLMEGGSLLAHLAGRREREPR